MLFERLSSASVPNPESKNIPDRPQRWTWISLKEASSLRLISPTRRSSMADLTSTSPTQPRTQQQREKEVAFLPDREGSCLRGVASIASHGPGPASGRHPEPAGPATDFAVAVAQCAQYHFTPLHPTLQSRLPNHLMCPARTPHAHCKTTVCYIISITVRPSCSTITNEAEKNIYEYSQLSYRPLTDFAILSSIYMNTHINI